MNLKQAVPVFAVVALAGMALVPLSANANMLDQYYFIGTWTGTFEDMGESADMELVFESDGTFEMTVDTFGFSVTITGEWKVEDDLLYMKLSESSLFEADESDSEWDEGTNYDFNTLGTEVTIGDESDEITFEKKGSICGVCCPFVFSLVLPATALMIGIVAYRRRR